LKIVSASQTFVQEKTIYLKKETLINIIEVGQLLSYPKIRSLTILAQEWKLIISTWNKKEISLTVAPWVLSTHKASGLCCKLLVNFISFTERKGNNRLLFPTVHCLLLVGGIMIWVSWGNCYSEHWLGQRLAGFHFLIFQRKSSCKMILKTHRHIKSCRGLIYTSVYVTLSDIICQYFLSLSAWIVILEYKYKLKKIYGVLKLWYIPTELPNCI
jgi:hypothetical protein